MAGELVLIVDDNELDVKLVRDVLRYHGFDTIEADSAELAVELAVARHPHLILMDIQLPDADGIDALAMLREQPHGADIPVVALTALAMPEDSQRLLAAGFCAHLPKPIDVRTFPARIRQLCGEVTEDTPCSSSRRS